MNIEDMENFLRKNILFRRMKLERVEAVANTVDIKKFQPGETIVREGDVSDELFVLLEGELQVQKAGEVEDGFVIALIHPGSYFGELAFIDGFPRSATIVALSSCKVLVISKNKIIKLKDGKKIINRIRSNIVNRGRVFASLRETSNNLIASLKKEKKLLKQQNEFGSFFVLSVMLLAFMMFVNHYVSDYVFKNGQKIFYEVWFNWTYLIIVAAPCIIYMKYIGKSFKEFGLNFNNQRQTLTESTAIILIALVALLYTIQNTSINVNFLAKNFFSIEFVSYFFNSAVQEFVSRGILQTSIYNFYGKNKTGLVIFISAFLFGAIHINFGFSAALVTFIFGILAGWLYSRHGNIIGISIIHALFGYTAYMIRLI